MQIIHLVQDVAVSADEIWRVLSDVTRAPCPGVQVQGVEPGDPTGTGVGAVRRVTFQRRTWTEHIHALEPTTRTVACHLTVVQPRLPGTLLRDCHGRMAVQPRGWGSRLSWEVRFRAAPPFLGGWLAEQVHTTMRALVQQLAHHLEQTAITAIHVPARVAELDARAAAAEAATSWKAAIQLRQDALLELDSLEQSRLAAVLFLRIGETCLRQDDDQSATIAFDNAMRQLARQPDQDIAAIIQAQRQMAKDYASWSEATLDDLRLTPSERDLATAASDDLLLVRVLHNAGTTYLRLHQEKAALLHFQQAIARPEARRDPVLLARILVHQGVALRRQERIHAARQSLQQALDLVPDAHHPDEVRRQALGALASILLLQQDWPAASQAYRQLAELHRASQDVTGEAIARIDLGLALARSQQWPDAQAAFARALELLPAGPRELRCHAWWGLGRCQEHAGDTRQAAASYGEAMALVDQSRRLLGTDEGKVSFLESVSLLGERWLRMHLTEARKSGDWAAALAASEDCRGAALGDLLRSRAQTPSGPTDSGAAPPAHPNNPAEQLTNATHGHWGADKPLVLLHEGAPPPPPKNRAKPPQTPAPSVAAPAPLARLCFHVMEDETAIWAVSPSGDVHGHVVPLGRLDLEERVFQLRAALKLNGELRGVRISSAERAPPDPTPHVPPPGAPDEPSPNAARQEPPPPEEALYQVLVAPLEPHLPAPAELLVVEPYGPLWLLPFAALRRADGQWMGARWPLVMSPGHAPLELLRRPPSRSSLRDTRALVVGNPAMPETAPIAGLVLHLAPLPSAEAEARAIARLFGPRATLLTGRQASRQQVEATAPSRQVLHLATHGLAFVDTPKSSFVALADTQGCSGAWTAQRVANHAMPSDLVVLSACQTGLGQIAADGLIGFIRAFLMAGAHAVVASLWSVDDTATTALMTAFYRHWLQDGDTARALWRAADELRRDPAHQDPRSWAPFILVGRERL